MIAPKDYTLIKLSRTERSKKKGKDRKIYSITLLGIIELLKTKKDDATDFVQFTDKLARSNPALLPLVFGKWHLFDQNQKIIISLKLRDFVRNAPSCLNELTMNTDELKNKPKEIEITNTKNPIEKLLRKKFRGAKILLGTLIAKDMKRSQPGRLP